MKHCFDNVEYRGKKITVSGWAVPENSKETLDIQVQSDNNNVLFAEIQRIKRPDVGLAMLQDEKMDQYGFLACIPYEGEGELFLKLTAGDENLRVALGAKTLYAEYKKDVSLLGKWKRYFKSQDKKNFWRLEPYYDYEEKDRKYQIWKELHTPTERELKKQRSTGLYEQPLISIIMPIYRPQFLHLKQMISSIENQTYTNWQLCIAGSEISKEAEEYLNRLSSLNRKVKVRILKENLGISGNTNAAMEFAAGEWYAFVDQDDLLRPDALYEYVRSIHLSSSDVLYCDEDKLDEETGIYFEPHFKPDFNPDLLLCNNYVGHMLMVRASLANEVGIYRTELDGAQDHDFILRCMEKSRRFTHIPQVLYSWRSHRDSTAMNPESKLYAYEAGENAINSYYIRQGIPGRAKMMPLRGWYRTSFTLTQQPLVSVIIPNKDHKEDLKRCISSLLSRTYQNIEILIVENNSENAETFAYYDELKKKDDRIKILTWKHPFNYSAINNFAAKEAKGEYLLLLNNDVECISEDFFESMLGYCMRKDVGAVGVKLYYPDDTIQHAGVLVGVSEGADHVFLHYDKENPGYMGRAVVSQDMTAVTAACMMVSASTYREVNGFDEAFTVAYNDVDFCLKLRQKDYLIVYDAFAEAYHYESATRGYEESEEQKQRFEQEKKLLKERWPVQLRFDPYYNENLSLKNGYYEI